MKPSDPEAQAERAQMLWLRMLRDHIEERMCAVGGHVWEEANLQMRHHTTAPNLTDLEKCSRCGEFRPLRVTTSTTSKTDEFEYRLPWERHAEPFLGPGVFEDDEDDEDDEGPDMPSDSEFEWGDAE